jgi:hypothetical protein
MRCQGRRDVVEAPTGLAESRFTNSAPRCSSPAPASTGLCGIDLFALGERLGWVAGMGSAGRVASVQGAPALAPRACRLAFPRAGGALSPRPAHRRTSRHTLRRFHCGVRGTRRTRENRLPAGGTTAPPYGSLAPFLRNPFWPSSVTAMSWTLAPRHSSAASSRFRRATSP